MHLFQDILIAFLKHSPIELGTKATCDIKSGEDIKVGIYLKDEGEIMIGVVPMKDIEIKPKKKAKK